MSEFIGEDIEVLCADLPGVPSSFVWRGSEHKIAEILSARQHLDFQSAWWRRRHREYFVVKTDTGSVFEIYFNRGPGRRYWTLYRKLER